LQMQNGPLACVGMALMEIRDNKLYQFKNGGKYETFEAYCKGVWDFKRTYAFYMIESARVVENVHHGEQNIPLPSTERQCRPFTKLIPEQQRIAWQKAVETAPEGKVTAAPYPIDLFTRFLKNAVCEIGLA